MKPLVNVLASLPATHQHETAKVAGVHPPAVVNRKRGVVSSPRARSASSTPAVSDDERYRDLRAMSATAGNLHRTSEELGGTYGVSVEPRFTNVWRRGLRTSLRLRPYRHGEPHPTAFR